MTEDRQDYDIGNIRALPAASFTAKDLRRFCEDRALFQPIVAQFGPKHGLANLVGLEVRNELGAALAKEQNVRGG